MSVAEFQSVQVDREIGSPANLLRKLAQRTLEYDFSVWFWGDAIAVDGLLEASEILRDSSYSEFCFRYFEAWSRRTLSWVDHLTPGSALLALYKESGNRALLDAAVRLANWLRSAPNAPGSGVHLYRPDLPPYRHTAWVDTLYHEPSFFCSLAQITGNPAFHQNGLDIWASHVRTLSSHAGPFLAHAYDTGARSLRGYGWGRGNGWALLGMADTLELLPKEHPGYQAALQDFQSLSQAIVATQDPSGFWKTLLAEQEIYLESSTAAFFGAAFLKGMRLNLLGVEYTEPAERAWRAMLSRIAADGSFFGVSACTYAAVEPGNDVALYRTLPTEVNVWGQGSALRFAGERIRSGLV
jgi:unsaturated rhamnogalacturonyl hydrolase